MELRHLRYFIAVAEAGNFTRAAERMHTVQPSLSRQIQQLEAEVGARLIERNSRQFQLTAAGLAFLDEARLVLAQMQRAVERAREAARGSKARMSLGFLPGVEVGLLVGVMTALRDELASVDLNLRSQSSPELISALHHRELDAAFVRPDGESDGLIMSTVRTERIIAALPSTHRHASSARVDIEDLANDRIITIARKSAPVLDGVIRAYLDVHGISLQASFEAEHITMAISLIASVGGVGLLPEYAISLLPKNVVAIPLTDGGPTIELALAYHPDNRSAALRTFLDYFLAPNSAG
jgi:LysR family hca operon transcriptional activator